MRRAWRGIFLAALLGGCGGADDTGTDQAALVRHEVRFRAEVNGEPFTCGRVYEGVGQPPARYQARDFRFYVHDVRLLGAGGTEVPLELEENAFQHDGVALLDFEDAGATCNAGTPELHPTLTGTAPEGDYRGLRFRLGVPVEKNHADPTLAPAPLNVTSMFWVWRGGYKFLRVDGGPADLPEAAFNVHLGSTGCPGDSPTAPPTSPCTHPNQVDVLLEGFDPITGTVVADIAPVLAGSDITFNTEGTSAGCIGAPDDPECEAILPRLGLPVGAVPAGEQVLFRGE